MLRSAIVAAFVSVFVLSGDVLYASNDWTNGNDNTWWTDSGNWSSGTVPTVYEEVKIDKEGWFDGPWIPRGVNDFDWGSNDGLAEAYNLYIGVDNEATLEVYQAYLQVPQIIYLGFNEGSSGTLYIGPDGGRTCFDPTAIDNGCPQSVRCYVLSVGEHGHGEVIQTGGIVRAYSEWFNLALNDPNATGHYQLDDGMVYTLGLYMGEGGSMDIKKGTVIINADYVAHPIYGDVIAGWVYSGQLTAYGGKGTIVYDYDQTYPGMTTIKAECGATGDLNGNCIVDMLDFAILADNWLKTVP